MKTGYTRLSGLTETDEVVEILQVIFDETVGRKLGTADDGSTLRTNPHHTGEGIFSAGTRAVTLKDEITIMLPPDRKHTFRGESLTQGFVYAGPRMKTINNLVSGAFDHTPDRLILNTAADEKDGLILEDYYSGGDIKQELGLRDMDSGITITTINSLKLTGTGSTSLDGTANRFDDFTNEPSLKTGFTIPAQIKTSFS